MPIDLSNRTIVLTAYQGNLDSRAPDGTPIPTPNYAPYMSGYPSTLSYVGTGPHTHNFAQYALDANDDPITFSLPVTRTGITIGSSTGILSVNAVGTSGAITIRVSDGVADTDYVISVTHAPAATGDADFIIPSNVSTWNAAASQVKTDGSVAIPNSVTGAIIELSAGTSTSSATAGTRGPLRISNAAGTALNPITVRNPEAGIITLSGSSSFTFEFMDSSYVDVDGTTGGQTYGIKATRPSSGTTGVTAFIKNSGWCRYITMRGAEIDGKVTNWTPGSGDAPGTPIGYHMHDNNASRLTLSGGVGRWQEGHVVENCYFHNVAGEGVYCGPNFNSTSMPIRNITIRNNLIEDTGRDGIQTKQSWEGPLLIENNIIRRAGRNRPDRDPGQLFGISVTGGVGTVRNNQIYETGESGIQGYCQNGPTAGVTYNGYNSNSPYTEFAVEVYNNLVVNTGVAPNSGTGNIPGTTSPANANRGNGITFDDDSTASDVRVHQLPKVYNNTLVDIENIGISFSADPEAGFARNNLIVSAGTNTSNGNGSTFSENTTSSSPASLFVSYSTSNTYAASDFHLLAATSPVGGTEGTHWASTDIEGTVRVTPDRGCYELLAPSTTYLGYTPTIYAAPADVGSGNGSSEANAMDLATALTTATAGDIVGLLPGVYSRTSPGGESRFAVAWNPTNSGTSGNPILFVAKYPAVMNASNSALWSEMQADLITTYGSPAFGSDGRDYIEWIGVYGSDETGHSASADDTSVCVLHSADHCAIKYCLIRGDGAKWGGNNYHGITVEDCIDTTITHNDVSNYYTGSVGAVNANGCGIMLDHSGTGTVERNYLHECGAGVFHKRADASGGGSYNHGNWVVRLNKLVDCEFGVRADSNQSSGQTTWTFDVYQNLMIGCNYGCYNGNSSNDLSGDVRFVNNTLVNCTVGHATNQQPYNSSAGHKFYNNIVYDPTQGFNWDEWSSAELSALSTADFLSNYNVWYSAATFMDGDAMSAQTLATWVGYGQDVNSITSDPLFTNYAGSVYTLQAGSPARNLGIDILNLQGGGTSASIHAGCYVTGTETIGTGY